MVDNWNSFPRSTKQNKSAKDNRTLVVQIVKSNSLFNTYLVLLNIELGVIEKIFYDVMKSTNAQNL